jgi:hypothetical protein
MSGDVLQVLRQKTRNRNFPEKLSGSPGNHFYLQQPVTRLISLDIYVQQDLQQDLQQPATRANEQLGRREPLQPQAVVPAQRHPQQAQQKQTRMRAKETLIAWTTGHPVIAGELARAGQIGPA